MEVRAWSYAEFPEFRESVDGAELIETTGEEIEVVYINDVPFSSADGAELRLQLLMPRTRNGIDEPLPCVAFVKGSAWRRQKLYTLIPQLARIAERGFVVAEIEYRPAAEAAFPAQIQDAQNAIRFLRSNAKRFGIDPDKMIAAGNSSGGHTAVFASFLDAGGSAYPDVSAEVRGVIDLYGAVSLIADDSFPITPEHHTPGSPECLLMGNVDMFEHPELREKGSVVTYVTPALKMPPILIVHGTKDRKVNAKMSVELFERLRSCGKDAELYLVQGADHGVAEFYTNRMIDIYERFIRRCLKQA